MHPSHRAYGEVRLDVPATTPGRPRRRPASQTPTSARALAGQVAMLSGPESSGSTRAPETWRGRGRGSANSLSDTCAATAAHTDPVASRTTAITVPSSIAVTTAAGIPSTTVWPR